MDSNEWETVVVEWANCLRLSKPIQNVKNLKDGEFFKNLLKLLIPHPEENSDVDTVIAIFQLLKARYPNFTFEDDTVISLSAISNDDLIALTSLLMHHTCITDRREVLTSPLCHRLSPVTQLSIKIFLEKVDVNVTINELLEIIQQCTGQGEMSLRNSYNWIASGDSPINNGSPLQTLLNRTPSSKSSRFFERDREIKKLKSELEQERYEKTDLQEELKLQCDRNTKLDKQLQQKVGEIKKLRGEIVVLENRTPPHFRDVDSFQEQRRLRSEIESLEQYVSQLENEQMKLAEEKDAACKRVKKLESECSLWQVKAVSLECTCDTFTEKSQKQEAEITMLRSHCEELTNVIEGLKSMTQFAESFADYSMAGGNVTRRSLDVENLAHTVVEVQLKEVQKENNDLKEILTENLSKSKLLNDELNSCRVRCDELNTKYCDLQHINEELNNKAAVLCETQLALEKSSEELSSALQSIAAVEKSNTAYQRKVTDLQVELEEVAAKLDESLSANKTLQSDLFEMCLKHDNMQQLFEEENLKSQRLEVQTSALQDDLNSVTTKYKNTCFELEIAIKKLNELDQNVETHLRRIERLVFVPKESKLNFDDKIEVFQKLELQIESNKLQDANDKKRLTEKIEAAEGVIKHLETEITNLQEQERLSLQERQNLQMKLESAEKSERLLQKTVNTYTNKINELNTTVQQMALSITELEKLKLVVEQKDSIISELEASKATMVESLEKASMDICGYKNFEERMTQINKELESQIEQLESELATAAQEISQRNETEKKLLQSLDDLTSTKMKLLSEVEHARLEIKERQKTEESNNVRINQLANANKSLQQEIVECNDRIKNQEKQIEIHLQKIEQLNLEKCNFIQELKAAQEEIFRHSVSQQELEEILEETKRKNLDTINELKRKVDENWQQILKLENDNQQIASEHNDALKEIENVKQEQMDVERTLQAKVTHYEKNIELLNTTVSRLEKNLSDNDLELNHLSKLYKQIVEERDRRITTCEALQKNIDDLSSMVNLKEKELAVKKGSEKEHVQELTQIKHDLVQKSSMIQELQIVIGRLNSEIDNMKVVNQSLTVEIEQREGEYKKEIAVLVSCKTALGKKCKEFEERSLSLLENLKRKEAELSDLSEMLKSNMETTQNEIQNLYECVNDKNKKIEELTSEHNTILNMCNKEIEQLNNQVRTLDCAIDSLNIKELDYIQEIRNVKDELNETIEKYTQALQLQQEMKSENDAQIANLTQNLHDIVEKYNKSEKTQAETSALLNKANEVIRLIESEKSSLENQLLEQQDNFEKSYNSMHNELTLQIQAAAKEKDDLNERVSKLLHDLALGEEQRKKTEDDMDNVRKQLEEMKCKNSSLEGDVQVSNNAYSTLEEKYNALHVEHDEYVKESAVNLTSLRREMSGQIEILTKEKELLKENFDMLNNKVLKLEAEKKNLVENYENQLNKNSKKIQRLQTLAIEYDNQMTALSEIKNNMEEQCENWKKLHEECLVTHKAEIQEYEYKITNSKCAQEILETGKQMLQKECDRLSEELKYLQEVKQTEQNNFTALITQKDEELGSLKCKMQQMENNCKQKESELLELERKFTVASEGVKALKTEQLMLEEAWKREKKAVVVEHNMVEKELEQQKDLYQNTLQSFYIVTEQLDSLKMEKLELEQQLDVHKEAEEDLKCLVKDYENVVAEKTQELNSLKVVIQSNELTISELNKQMEDYLKNLSLIQTEKIDLQQKLEAVESDLVNVQKSRDEILENQTRIINETETNILRAHNNTEKIKSELLRKIEHIESEKLVESRIKLEIEDLLAKEIESRKALEASVLELTKEKSQFKQLCTTLRCGIERLKCIFENKSIESCVKTDIENNLDLSSVESINEALISVENRIIEVMEKKQALLQGIAALEKEKVEASEEIQQLKQQTNSLVQEKEKLICDYELLNNEKCSLLYEKTTESKSLEDLQSRHDLLQARYEQIAAYTTNNEQVQKKNEELQKLVMELRNKQMRVNDSYDEFSNYIKKYKADIKTLVAERALLDQTLTNLRINMATLQTNIASLNTVTCRQLLERKDTIDIIVDDIYKQSSRLSKRIGEVACNGLQVSENILSNGFMKTQHFANDMKNQLNMEDDLEKISDLKERATDILQQILSLNTDVESKRDPRSQSLNENVALQTLKTTIDIKTEEEWKKKNMALRQRLTLADNAKLHLERKVKQLREENKTLMDSMKLSSGVVYKDSNAESELEKIRNAYASVMTEKSQLQLEIATMKNILEDRTQQLGELNSVKDAYEHLLEENAKLLTEIDTLNYKRTRDREEYSQILKEREECQGKENRQIQEIRNEYEVKLEKMKQKMVKLYKEEVDKEMQKMSAEKSENVYLIRTIEQLKHHLKDAKMKILETGIERDRAMDRLKQLQSRMEAYELSLQDSKDSVHAVCSSDSSSIHSALPRGIRDTNSRYTVDPRQLTRTVSTGAVAKSGGSLMRKSTVEQRKMATLPRSSGMDVIEEITISRRTSISSLPSELGQNLRMEDEEDDFNNKYLSDLKEGRCITAAGESDPTRISELIWRNSMCPPHLKSSYPAETQFASPSRFKEDDIKTGIVEFDDSSTKLLPGEKARIKKDIGTTSYKKPGPPTPSKNGGRLSLQGSDVHPRDALREHNSDGKTPKRTTPSRLKALFMGRNSSVRDNSENQPPGTPKGRRLTIFRKAR